MAAGFVSALKRHSLEVQKLEGAQAEEFLRLLQELQDRLRGRYLSVGASDDPLDVFRLRALIAETESGIAILTAKTQGLWTVAAKDSVDLATEHVGDEIDRLAKAFDEYPLDVAIDAQKVLADPAQGLLADHFVTSVQRYGGDLLNKVRQELFIGLKSGDSIGDVARAIAGKTGPFGQVGQANADRLVRTEVSNAYGAATHSSQSEAEKQVPGLKKVWLHVASFICKTCIPLHGTERPIDGTWTVKSGRKTRKVAHPPAHPNCTCRTTTMKPSWRAGLQKLGYLHQTEASVEEADRPTL